MFYNYMYVARGFVVGELVADLLQIMGFQTWK